MAKEKKQKILELEAEMGRYYNQIDACQSTVAQIRPKLSEVILKLQKLRKEQ